VSAGVTAGLSPGLLNRIALLGVVAFASALGVALAADGGGEPRAGEPVGSLAVPIERSAAGGDDLALVSAETLPRLGAVDALPALAEPAPEPASAMTAPAPAVSAAPAPASPSAPAPRAPEAPSSSSPTTAPPPEPVVPAPPAPEDPAPPAPDPGSAPSAPAPDSAPIQFDDSG
jgi:hypothetical protein